MVLEILASLGAGVLIGWSLAVPPGPVNAVIASTAVQRSWRSGFLVGLGATSADAIFLSLSVVAHEALLGVRPVFPIIGLVGALVLGFFAWSAVRSWSRVLVPTMDDFRFEASSYARGLAINITSPYPILWWLTVGLVLIDQLGPAVLVGFFSGLLSWISAFPYALQMAQQRFARTYHAVLAFSIACLAAFAGWLAWTAIASLL